MTIANAETFRSTAAFNALHEVVVACYEQTTEELLPFNTNPKFNAFIARQMRLPGFVLTNGQWDLLVSTARDSLVPEDGNCSYSTEAIRTDKYGAALNFVLLALATTYGKAEAFKVLNRNHPAILPNTTFEDVAHAAALKVIIHESDYKCGYGTLPSIVISKQMNAAQTKVTLAVMVKCAVTNHIKEVGCQPELNPFEHADVDVERQYQPDEFGVEDQMQLEYLRDLMSRPYSDIEEPVAKMVIETYFSDEGQKVLRNSDSPSTTFLSQLRHLSFLTGLSKYETKRAHDTILSSFWQLLRLSTTACTGERQRIKDKGVRSRVRNGQVRYEGEAALEQASYMEISVTSPYLDNEDVDLMIEAAGSDHFFAMS